MDSSCNEDGSRHVPKKRSVSDTWTRRLIQRKRIAGEAHVNHVGKFVPERTTGAECRCRKHCMASISIESRQNILEFFNKMENKNLQDTYLAGLVTATLPQRRRSRLQEPVKEHTAVFHYKVKYDGSEKIVCKAAFLSLHGISPARLRRICVLIQQGVVSPKDLRGGLREKCCEQPQTRLQLKNKMLEINIKCEPYSEEISQEETSEGDVATIKVEPDFAAFMTPKTEPEDWHFMAIKEHINIKEESLESDDTLQTPVMRPKTSNDHLTRNTRFEDPSEATCEESFEETSVIKYPRSNQINSFRRHEKRFSTKMLKDDLSCVQFKQKARKSASHCLTADAQTQFHSSCAVDSNFEFYCCWNGNSVCTQACIRDIKM